MTQDHSRRNCSCPGHYTDKWHRWTVLQRGEGGARSRLYCLDCRAEWRSAAKYVVLLPDHRKRSRSGLTDQEVLDAVIERRLYSVDVDAARVKSATGAVLRVEHRTHKEGEQRGTYRFVNICVDGRKKKVALHRLVWMVAHKQVPPVGHDIDHVHSQEDDTIGNLRLMTSEENRGQAGRQKTSQEDEEEVPF